MDELETLLKSILTEFGSFSETVGVSLSFV